MAKPLKANTTKITDALGVDFGKTSTKLVRIRKAGQGFSLVEADVMPPFDFGEPENLPKLSLPKKLASPYAAACLTTRDVQVRFMFISNKLQDAKSIQGRVAKSLGLGPDYRVGHAMVERGKDGLDHKILASAIPTPLVKSVLGLFSGQKTGLVSLQTAGLAALNSFSHLPEVQETEGAVCYLEAGALHIVISFFINGELRLVRKFDLGSEYIQQRVQEVLSVGPEEALTVLFEDATPLMETALDPVGSLLQEISISKKFVERNENAVIGKAYASGGLSYSPYWMHLMSEVLGCPVEVWNPFEPNGIKQVPKGVQGVESMFAPAMGAAMAAIRNV